MLLSLIHLIGSLATLSLIKPICLKKGKNENTVMMYKSNTNEYELSNRTLGLYVVENFVFELQKPGPAIGRSTSARFTRN
jgi:hypothetical protein